MTGGKLSLLWWGWLAGAGLRRSMARVSLTPSPPETAGETVTFHFDVARPSPIAEKSKAQSKLKVQLRLSHMKYHPSRDANALSYPCPAY